MGAWVALEQLLGCSRAAFWLQVTIWPLHERLWSSSWVLREASWAPFGLPWAPSEGVLEHLEDNTVASWSDTHVQVGPSWHQKRIRLGSSVTIAQKLKNIILLV